MIVIDTMILSELARPSPDPQILEWLNSRIMDTLFITAVTIAEIRFGIANWPEGKRRDALEASLSSIITLFGDRILDFDRRAAEPYAALALAAKRAGRELKLADAFIAATAAAHGYTLATQDKQIRAALPLTTVNPWTAGD